MLCTVLLDASSLAFISYNSTIENRCSNLYFVVTRKHYQKETFISE